MGLHRTLLFLLVVGLIIAAFRRGGGGVSAPETRQTALALTNSAASRALAAGPDPGK